ncbi:hypothetical protein BC940DRAFT_35270 [Gongronella butleri]|nr:hypothetical protein BC940DRAFT_35270 [Gongronella butleri]
MFYSFAFCGYVARLCMDDLKKRGLTERKILRKSAPNNVLLYKTFYHQVLFADDLPHFSVHSIATLLQDILWGCEHRILPKKSWRLINYETCTLHQLEHLISREGYDLLVDIVDFLVLVMQHKRENQMHAYHLGEAMGKVTLGPADCDPLLAEKAGHFMTRMIIDRSKHLAQQRKANKSGKNGKSAKKKPLLSQSVATNASAGTQAASQAKAKSYDRLILRKKRQCAADFIFYANSDDSFGLVSLLDYDDDPWLAMVPAAPKKGDDDNESDESEDDACTPDNLQCNQAQAKANARRVLRSTSIFDMHVDPALSEASPALFRILTSANGNEITPLTRKRASFHCDLSKIAASASPPPQMTLGEPDGLASSQGSTIDGDENAAKDNSDVDSVLMTLDHAFDDVQQLLDEQAAKKELERQQIQEKQARRKSLKASFKMLVRAVKQKTAPVAVDMAPPSVAPPLRTQSCVGPPRTTTWFVDDPMASPTSLGDSGISQSPTLFAKKSRVATWKKPAAPSWWAKRQQSNIV